ncbi:hypothetical protein QFC21_000748 [Naganishia friedmannii]|uniref:Uncharacterized protein n=1 Tax=Naganishia friedmannii TaxID=89922 RepID=A0ACC2W7A4_9TREE|nr:hypothetical protein QFC21_000748 [Naganishia friedmannii]
MSATYPHITALSTSYQTSSYATQSNLETLIAKHIAHDEHGAGEGIRRRSSAASHQREHRPAMPRGYPSAVNEGMVFDDEDDEHHVDEASSLLSRSHRAHDRQSSVVSQVASRIGGAEGRRLSTSSYLTSRDRNRLAKLTSIVGGGEVAEDDERPLHYRQTSSGTAGSGNTLPPPRTHSRRASRTASMSRSRIAAGETPGFTSSDVEAAAETFFGSRADGYTPQSQQHMLLDPAEELDPAEDLELPTDNKGMIVESWRPAVAAELKVLVKTAGPVFFTQVAEYSLILASVISIGHLSTVDLAASSLAGMTASVTAFSIIQGMASALDTLLPAAWTSSDPTRVGLWTQRMFIVAAVSLIPMYLLWFQAESILLFLRQDPVVAARAGLYLRYLSIGLPGYAGNLIMRKYFQSQNLMKAPTIVLAIIAPMNAVLNYLLVWGPKSIRLGFVGAPLATAISFNAAALVSIGYAAFFAPKTAWGGFDRKEAFRKLGTITSLGLAGTIMVSSEWWAWEGISLSVSMLGPVALAVNSILLSFSSILFQIPQSMGIATAVRVGNLLGAGRPYEARLAAILALILSIITSVFNSALLVIFRNKIAYIFNTDPEVVVEVGKVTIYVAAFQIADGLVGSSGGVLRAVGKQSAGALINLTAYYVLGLPFGIYLCFKRDMGLIGLWLGLTLALFYAGLSSVWIILRVDWPHAVDKARDRLGLPPLEEGKAAVDVPSYGTMMGGH